MIQKKLRLRNILIGSVISAVSLTISSLSINFDWAEAQEAESPSAAINQGGTLHQPDSQGYINVNIGESYSIEMYTPRYVSAVIIKIDGVLVTGNTVGKRLLCLTQCSIERPFATAKKFIVLQEGNPGLGKDGGVNNPNLGLVEITFMPMKRRELPQQPPVLKPVMPFSSFPATTGSTVRTTDWEFAALGYIVERYGCIASYPDRTFRGSRAITRYEFAAGLNACLDKMNELISSGLADKIRKDDLAILRKLQEEFAAELAMLRGRVDSLEAKTAPLEAQQFSTTTKLNASANISVSGTNDNNIVLDGRVDGTKIPQQPEASKLSTIPQPTMPKPNPAAIAVGTGLGGDSAQRFQLSTEWVDAPELAPIVTKKYRLVGVRQEPTTLQNMGNPNLITDPTPPRVPSSEEGKSQTLPREGQGKVLIDLFSPGYYNNSLGDLYSGNPKDLLAQYFRGSNGSTGEPDLRFSKAPDLAAVEGLRDWLLNPEAAIRDGLWQKLLIVPTTWAENTETAIIYEVDGGEQGYDLAIGNFGVDNGIFVWVNGVYQFGATNWGNAEDDEYPNIPLGRLKPGKNYIQVLRADNGAFTDYKIKISGFRSRL